MRVFAVGAAFIFWIGASLAAQREATGTWFAVSKEDGVEPVYYRVSAEGAPEVTDSRVASRQFAIGSNTKPMTALLMIQAEEQWKKKGGAFNLDATLSQVARLIDEADLKNGLKHAATEVSPKFAGVTVRMILSHIGGMPGEGGIPDIERSELLSRVFKHGPYAAARTDGSPGRVYSYSDQGYAVLGEILERLSEPHQTYRELVQSKIFGPLKMKGCGFTTSSRVLGQKPGCATPQGTPPIAPSRLDGNSAFDSPLIDPAAGGYCTLPDWLKFVRYQMALLNKTSPKGLILEDPDSTNRMLQMFPPKGYYSAGALMFTSDPPAAYQQGSNGDHYSLSWFQTGGFPSGQGIAVVGASVGIPYSNPTFGNFQKRAEALAIRE